MFFKENEMRELSSNAPEALMVVSLDEAYAFCEKTAKRHYENFPVGSLAVPKSVRHHFYAVYAFARLGDEIADEYSFSVGTEAALLLLENLTASAEENFVRHGGNPIFWALSCTMSELNIPREPLISLLHAFKMDVNFCQPGTWADLYFYCQHSANPIGELVLRIFGEYDAEKAIYSDKICTGLQMANFWQDLSLDLACNRLYIPKNLLEVNNISSKDLLNKRKNIKLQRVLNDLYQETYLLLSEGTVLINKVEHRRLALELKLIIAGGLKILSKTIRLRERILVERPRLRRTDMIAIFFKSIFS